MSFRFLQRTLVPTFRMISLIAGSSKQVSTLCRENTHIMIRPTQTRLFCAQTTPENMIVNFDEVQRATSDEAKYIIDVREPSEIKEHGKIPNSINIPLGEVTNVFSTMSDKDFEKTYGRPKPCETHLIICYCMIGKRSGMAQQNMINLGYKNVKNYLGSWTDWAAKTKSK